MDEKFLELYLRPGFPADALGVKWSGRERAWFHEGFYHCLPLQMANQLGWCVTAPDFFQVHWTGGPSKETLRVSGCPGILSYFGHGVFTYTPPFVFRTPPGVNLLIKAVPNSPKHGVCPLEGYVETDNLRGSLTFNFRITKPGTVVTYEKGEPMAQILPYPRGWLEQFEPRALARGERYDEFVRDVLKMEKLRRGNIATKEAGVKQRDWRYFRGEDPDGTKWPEHQKKLELREFESPGGIAGESLVAEVNEIAAGCPHRPVPSGR